MVITRAVAAARAEAEAILAELVFLVLAVLVVAEQVLMVVSKVGTVQEILAAARAVLGAVALAQQAVQV
jgi:hypothetical protein